MFLKVFLINLFSCSTDNETEQEDCAAENNLNDISFENPVNDDISINDGGELSSTEGSSKTNEEKSQVHNKRAANAIERDKAVRRKVTKLSNKEVTLKSSEALATAIRDMSQASEQSRKDDLKLWFEHERLEREKDRELKRMKLEMKERESKRRYELEMMRLGQPKTLATYSRLPEQPLSGYNNGTEGNIYSYINLS